jgi:hypothetical protein
MHDADFATAIGAQAQALSKSGWHWLGGESDLPVVFIFERHAPQFDCRELVLFDTGEFWTDAAGQRRQRYIHYLVFYDPECADRLRQ